jgi:hypothetical protein
MRPLKRPMFKTGGPIKEGVMNGLRDGGVATTMADATMMAGGGMIRPGYDIGGGVKPPLSQYVLSNQKPNINTGRLNIGVPDQPNLTKMQKAKNIYQKGKGFFKSPTFSERGIKTLAQRKLPQYAKGLARFLGSSGVGMASRFPIATRLAPYYAMYKASEVTPVDEKYGISRTDNLFAPFKSNTVEIMQKKALRNAEQAANPNNFYRYDSGKYGPRKDHPNYDPKKVKYNPFSEDTGAADTEIPRDADGNIIRFNDAESMFGLKKLKATPGYSKEDREIKKEKVEVPEVKGTKEERDAYAKKFKEDQDKIKLDKIYNLLGVKRAQANAASKALIDMSRYIDEGGKDTISRKNIGSTISKAIGAFDKRLDKADQLKEAAGLMIAKGEIEKDIYGAKPGTQLKAAQDYQAQFGGTLKDAYKALGIGRKDMSVTVSESLIKGARKSTDLVEAAYQAEGNPPAVLTVKSKDFTDWQNDNEGKTELDYVSEITDRKPGAYIVGTRVVIVDKELNPSFYY